MIKKHSDNQNFPRKSELSLKFKASLTVRTFSVGPNNFQASSPVADMTFFQQIWIRGKLD